MCVRAQSVSMELECVRCANPTSVHCSNEDCHWTICVTIGCGWIYSGAGVIPTWERYLRDQGAKP